MLASSRFTRTFSCACACACVVRPSWLVSHRCSRLKSLNLQQGFSKLFRICLVPAAVYCGSIFFQRRSVCSALIELLLLSRFFSRASQLHHPPLPPTFYSQCFPSTLALRVAVNIIFLVNNVSRKKVESEENQRIKIYCIKRWRIRILRFNLLTIRECSWKTSPSKKK